MDVVMEDDLQAIHERRLLTATERYRNDVRFNAAAQSVVARVMNKHGQIDPERADREACDIAIRAVLVILQTLYEEHGEVSMLRREADMWKKVAEENIGLRPMPPIVLKGA